MYAVNYHRASSVAEAASMLESGDAKLLSGGMTLIPAMKTRLSAPSDVVDLAHIAEMKGISVNGGVVTIGAGTTHAEVADDEQLRNVFPGLAGLAWLIGDPHVRHKGTIGGSIANNDPAADYPAALLAVDATVVTNQREIEAVDFFTGLFETALADGEVVIAVRLPIPEKSAYQKFRNPASRYAIVGVFVARTPSGARVAVAGAGENGVFRATSIETALGAAFDPAAVDNVTISPAELMSDMHASPEYRANLIKVMAKRAVAQANA